MSPPPANPFPEHFAPPAVLTESAAADCYDLIDISDSHDNCPSFAFPIETPLVDRNRADYSELFATIWCEHPDPQVRESGIPQRFRVVAANPGDASEPYFTYATDDVLHALRIAHEMSQWATSVFADTARIMDNPTYPDKPIEDFSDLHEHCDANVLGLGEVMWERYDAAPSLRNLRIDLMNAVQNMVNDWIAWRSDR